MKGGGGGDLPDILRLQLTFRLNGFYLWRCGYANEAEPKFSSFEDDNAPTRGGLGANGGMAFLYRRPLQAVGFRRPPQQRGDPGRDGTTARSSKRSRPGGGSTESYRGTRRGGTRVHLFSISAATSVVVVVVVVGRYGRPVFGDMPASRSRSAGPSIRCKYFTKIPLKRCSDP